LLPIWAISPRYWSIPLHMHGDKNSRSGEKIKHMGVIIADLAPFSHSRSNKCARARRERFLIQLIIDRRRCSQPDHVASWVSDVRMRTQGEEAASGTFAWLGSLESPDGQLETYLLIRLMNSNKYTHAYLRNSQETRRASSFAMVAGGRATVRLDPINHVCAR
jgi:hypothetical protein